MPGSKYLIRARTAWHVQCLMNEPARDSDTALRPERAPKPLGLMNGNSSSAIFMRRFRLKDRRNLHLMAFPVVSNDPLSLSLSVEQQSG